MQHPMHASHGAGALGTYGAVATGDARRSIMLFGSTTASTTLDGPAHPGDPVAAARAWLAEPQRRSALGDELVHRAEESISYAQLHLRELDLLAGELAREANETGNVDPLRLHRLDAMSSLLRAWAERMRAVLDPDRSSPTDARERLDAALAAARQGGLAGFVGSL